MPICTVGLLLWATAICQQTRPAPTTRPASENWWQSDGLVVAASLLSVEEQAWITTAGRLKKPTRDELAAYARLHTAEMLERLRTMGVNLVVLPYGGYDPDDRERDARQRSVAFARVCHAAGMKVGVIIPIGSVDPERWAETEPGVADVLTLSRDGRPFPAGPFGRMMTSRISRWERRRSDRLVREAVRATDPDMIVLPNFLMAVNREPSGVAAFEADLRGRSPAGAAPRTGEARETLRTEYRIAALADSLSAIRDVARGENTDVLICLNGQGLDRQVAPVAGPAVDPPSLWPLADVLWSDMRLSVGARGRIRHLITQYKAAPLVLPTPRSALEAAQALAFNHGAVGCVAFLREGHLSGEAAARAPLREDVLAMARFSRAHRVLFAGQRSVSDVCIYRSRASGLYADGAVRVLTIQTEQALVSHHFVFEIRELGASVAVQRDVSSDHGRTPPIMMLGGAERLSDGDIAWIESQLRDGRGLVLIGPCGVRDELGHARAPALIDRLLADATGSPPESAPGRPVKFVYGGGRSARVAYLPRPGPMENVWLKIARPHRPRPSKPADDDALHETVRWVTDRPLTVAGHFASSVAVELTTSDDGGRLVLHRVNFDSHGATQPIRVTVRIPASRRAVSIERFTPDDAAAPTEVEFTSNGGTVTFEAAVLKVYDAHLIRTEPATNATQPASSGERSD